MYTCPKGHNSTEADFCSECGAKITGLGIAELVSNPTNKTTATVSQSVAVQHCPDCSTPHQADSGNFCEICGFNFLTGAKGGDPLFNFPPPIRWRSLSERESSINTTATAPTQPPNPPANPSNPAPNAISRWQVVISIDPSLATPTSPTAPTQAPIVIELSQPTNLIGRTSVARAIHPEIPLDLDDAVSSRHAILTLHPNGTLIIRDIGSSNGTLVNGKEIAVMADISIASGDEITLGHWTRIKVTAV
ncbi:MULTISPECIES: FHA domain-containing protein [unclassified Chamaesiphon]|uniref:FHA domain-containing protein n=1 Tax=unclassified Chamaesiphon TaxID=2620921 RepID=UPI00286A4823|nr:MULTISPECIES: FHA domain-containing protein [unclassified Chamaesiphon]